MWDFYSERIHIWHHSQARFARFLDDHSRIQGVGRTAKNTSKFNQKRRRKVDYKEKKHDFNGLLNYKSVLLPSSVSVDLIIVQGTPEIEPQLKSEPLEEITVITESDMDCDYSSEGSDVILELLEESSFAAILTTK